MHRVYRQLIFGAIAVISLISTCNRCHKRSVFEASQRGWTPALEQQMYDVFYERASRMGTDDTQRRQFANCCVEKLKERFPNGPASMTNAITDSLTIVGMKIGAECSKGFENHVNIWQPEVVEQFKLRVYSYPETKLLPEEAKSTYVDCITFKVKAEFPNGLGESKPKVLKDFIEKCRTECIKLTVNKYKKRLKKKAQVKKDTLVQ
jgi:hypothetical protein